MSKNKTVEGKPSRHAVIMRGVVTPILGLLAVACLVLGLLNATEWKPSRNITAEADAPAGRYVLVDPAVLPLVDEHVTLTATLKGERAVTEPTDGADGAANPADGTDTAAQVCVALTNPKDAAGWLQGQQYTRVTGMADWEHMTVRNAAAHGEAPADATGTVSFADSDMWSEVACGTDSAKMSVKDAKDTQVALIDLGEGAEGAKGATITFAWVRETLPDFAMPFYFAAGLLAVLAVLTASVFAMPAHKRRKRVVVGEAKTLTEAGEEVRVSEALAGSLSGVGSMFRKSKSRHGRRGGKGSAASAETISMPVVVDPSARNMVADTAAAAATDMTAGATVGTDAMQGSSTEETSVISPDELAAYFARFAAEGGSGDGAGAASATESTDEEGSGK